MGEGAVSLDQSSLGWGDTLHPPCLAQWPRGLRVCELEVNLYLSVSFN